MIAVFRRKVNHLFYQQFKYKTDRFLKLAATLKKNKKKLADTNYNVMDLFSRKIFSNSRASFSPTPETKEK